MWVRRKKKRKEKGGEGRGGAYPHPSFAGYFFASLKKRRVKERGRGDNCASGASLTKKEKKKREERRSKKKLFFLSPLFFAFLRGVVTA